MQLNEMTFSDATPIDSYGPGFFRVGGEVLRGATLVHRDGAGAWGGFEDVATLQAFAGKADVILVGTGGEMVALPADFRAALEEVGLGIDMMQTPTACRSYNVLLAEGRRVVAALLPMPEQR